MTRATTRWTSLIAGGLAFLLPLPLATVTVAAPAPRGPAGVVVEQRPTQQAREPRSAPDGGPSVRAAAAPSIDPTASAGQLAAAISAEPGTVVGGEFVERPPEGNPTAASTVPVAGFPREGTSYAVLSTGDSLILDQPNGSSSSGVDDQGGPVRGNTSGDVTVLRLDLAVPQDVNCLVGFDFRFLSEEFPEYVGSSFNDAFVAELDESTWTTEGSTILAPDNFAFDPNGNVISINAAGATSMSAEQALGTTFDGATTILSAATPITPGAHRLFLSIFDQGDHAFDSAVLVDNLRFGRVADVAQDCRPGAAQAVAGIPLGQTFGALGGAGQGGIAANPGAAYGDPVATATGNWTTSVTDSTLAGSGRTNAFVRSYNSLDDTVGELGLGWSHTFEASLDVDEVVGTVVARTGGGQRLTFARALNGDWVGDPGARSRLARLDDGWILSTDAGDVYAFDAVGLLESIVDQRGAGASLHREDDLTTSVDLARDRSWRLVHDGAGRLTELGLPDGRRTTYAYEGTLLVSVTDQAGGTTLYEHDAAGRITAVVDAGGRTVVTNEYAADGRVSAQVDGNGTRTEHRWDPASTTSTVISPSGHRSTDVYTDGLLVSRTDPLGAVTSLEWDADYQLARLTAPDGTVEDLSYTDGALASVTSPGIGSLATFTTAGDLPTEVSEADGATTALGYEDGRLTTVEGEEGTGATLEWTPEGLLSAVVDGAGTRTRMENDERGDLVVVTTALGNRTQMRHDATGRVVAVVDPRGSEEGADATRFTTTYAWDALDRLVERVDPLGHTTRTTYDASGDLVRIEDAKGRTTTTEYDGRHHAVAVITADGARTRYAYDAEGAMTSRVDALGRTTTYDNDALGRRTAAVDPGGHRRSWTYDVMGRLSSTISPNGHATPEEGDGVVTFGYDPRGRLTDVDYAGDTPDVHLVLDADGRVTTMEDGEGVQERTYDAVGRPTSVTRGDDVFSYGYDSVSRLTSRSLPDGTEEEMAYDADGRLTSFTSGTLREEYSYDADGQRTRTERSAGGHRTSVRTERYDRAGRLVGMHDRRGQTTVARYDLVLDPTDNPVEIDEGSKTRRLAYDARDRMVRACERTVCTDYGYDALGNRVSADNGSRKLAYAYDESGRQVGAGLAHDANGNLLQAPGVTARYDEADRLVGMTRRSKQPVYRPTGSAGRPSEVLGPVGLRPSSPTTEITLGYDGEGNRTDKSVTKDYRMSTTSYAFDVSGPLATLVLERPSEGGWKRYAQAAGPVGVSTQDGQYALHTGVLGSVVATTDEQGAVVADYAYDVDGHATPAPSSTPGAPVVSLRWTGEHLDADTALYDLRARQYDPSSARFLQSDPVDRGGFVGSHVYADSRPLSMTDPSGRCPWCVLAAVGAVTGGVVGAVGYYVGTPAADRDFGGVARAAAGGAVVGGLVGLTGPLGGSIALGLGASSTGALAIGTTFALNAAAGAAGTWFTGQLAGQPASGGEIAVGAVSTAFGGAVGARLVPVRGVGTLKQARYFAPRTFKGAFPQSGRKTINDLYASDAAGSAFGAGLALGLSRLFIGDTASAPGANGK